MSNNVNNSQTKNESAKSPVEATKASITFYYLIAGSIMGLIIGAIWAIIEAIQPDDKWDLIANMNTGLKIAIFGALAVFIFGMLIGGWVMFKRGNKMIHKMLYPATAREEITKDNKYAQVITILFLITIVMMIVGLIVAVFITLFENYTGGISLSLSYPTGFVIMIISLIICVLTLLTLSIIWLWNNGYFTILNSILKYNQPVDDFKYEKNQILTAQIFFVSILVAAVTIGIGAIWTILDLMAPDTGDKWSSFTGFNVGTQIFLIGFFVGLIVSMIIGCFLFQQRGVKFVLRILFSKKPDKAKVDETDKLTKIAKSITLGMFIAIVVIITGILISLIEGIVYSVSQNADSIWSFIDNIDSVGLVIVIISAMILSLIWGIIGIFYLWQNGYYIVLNKVIEAQDKLDKD